MYRVRSQISNNIVYPIIKPIIDSHLSRNNTFFVMFILVLCFCQPFLCLINLLKVLLDTFARNFTNIPRYVSLILFLDNTST